MSNCVTYVSLTLFKRNSTYIGTAGLARDCRVDLRWRFCCGCPISRPRPVFDFSRKKTGSFLYFPEMSKSKLVWPKYMQCFWQIQRKIDGSPIIAMRKRIRVIRSYNQFVPTILKKLLGNRLFVLAIAWTQYSGCIPIDTHFDQRDQFSSKNTAVGLSKKSICRNLRHLRST